MDPKDSIRVTIRSFIFPDKPIVGFDLGKPFTMDLPNGLTLGEFTRRIFFKKLDQIGVVAINGELASGEIILLPGDSIDLYPLLGGG